jgi:hypothetical protein
MMTAQGRTHKTIMDLVTDSTNWDYNVTDTRIFWNRYCWG